ncbi:hypothetical protein AB0K04_08615 [Micromonospora coxensis]|uniref:hypothetical protein n=1 Tax=Micromonospora coxensis TaxID=356852 RepID=UPI003423D621
MHDRGPVVPRSVAAPLGAAVFLTALLLAGCSRSAESSAQSPGQPKQSPALSTRFEAPEQLAGLPRSPDAFTYEQAKHAANLIKRYVSQPTGTFGEVYTSETSLTDSISISAVTGTVANPTEALDRLYATTRDMQDVRPAEPGPLGGEARCGRSDEAMVYTATICGWADSGSIGMLTIKSLEKRDRRDEFGMLRAQVQQAATADPS